MLYYSSCGHIDNYDSHNYNDTVIIINDKEYTVNDWSHSLFNW